jgi:hypothetical protein
VARWLALGGRAAVGTVVETNCTTSGGLKPPPSQWWASLRVGGPVAIARHYQNNPWPSLPDWSQCRNADAGLRRTNGKTNDAGLTFIGIPASAILFFNIMNFKKFDEGNKYFRMVLIWIQILMWHTVLSSQNRSCKEPHHFNRAGTNCFRRCHILSYHNIVISWCCHSMTLSYHDFVIAWRDIMMLSYHDVCMSTRQRYQSIIVTLSCYRGITIMLSSW